ncbi:hypothetical protein Arub01_14420 [Actinomadura rubrobrunea]|uniref:Uncharacterized protein n=1 Tax=Actinomadura rubrobrunea TaxID=115335 RepID=A0A9W6UUT6_9ACTN|nr:hypothetical protein [Actinomadura rubrobrunea]GLW63198.1 hypothetical protein Arub01_14420 [Actinomadura rubrobrunea]
MIASPPSRTARSAIFAVVCVCLTALGHRTASGEPMSPDALLWGFFGVWAVALPLAGHERSLPTILGGLLGGQFVLHALFSTGELHYHHHHCSAHPVSAAGHGGTAMTVAHLLAAGASAWWLRRGERAAWRLARLAASVLLRPLWLTFSAPAPQAPRAAVPRTQSSAPPRIAPLRHVLVLRGPPAPVPGR